MLKTTAIMTFAFVTSVTAAMAEPSAERLRAALQPLLGDSPRSRAEIGAFAAKNAEADSAQLRALVQAAELSQSADSAITRAFARDAARLLLAQIAGPSAPVMQIWDQRDPVLARSPVDGLVLSESDIRAVATFDPTLDGDIDAARALTLGAWEENEGQFLNQMFLTRADAWLGALNEAAYLPADAEDPMTAVIREDTVPPSDMLRDVIGTDDLYVWTTARLPHLTKAEAEAAPELAALFNDGTLGDGLAPVAASDAGDNSMAGISATTEALGAMTAEQMVLDTMITFGTSY